MSFGENLTHSSTNICELLILVNTILGFKAWIKETEEVESKPPIFFNYRCHTRVYVLMELYV